MCARVCVCVKQLLEKDMDLRGNTKGRGERGWGGNDMYKILKNKRF